MTETQLRLMIDAVEDWHRFLAGQCGMDNVTSGFSNRSRDKRTFDTVDNENDNENEKE